MMGNTKGEKDNKLACNSAEKLFNTRPSPKEIIFVGNPESLLKKTKRSKKLDEKILLKDRYNLGLSYFILENLVSILLREEVNLRRLLSQLVTQVMITAATSTEA